MRVNRNYFCFVLIVFLFLITINSCLNNDPQKKNDEEHKSSDSTNKSLPQLKNEAIADTFIFNIHHDLPDFIFILFANESKNVQEIRVYSSNDLKLIQNIPQGILLERPPGYDFFFTEDYNFDGYKDIALLLEHGATVNMSYRVWLYNRSKNIFETNDFFEEIDRPILDERKKQITTYVEYGGFDEYYERTYKLKNNKFILIYEVKYWRDYIGDIRNNNYLQMKDSSIGFRDTLKLISRKKYGP